MDSDPRHQPQFPYYSQQPQHVYISNTPQPVAPITPPPPAKPGQHHQRPSIGLALIGVAVLSATVASASTLGMMSAFGVTVEPTRDGPCGPGDRAAGRPARR